MSIRWVRNVNIDDQKSTLEIQLGSQKIGDKCYTRVNTDVEKWFDNISESREDIIAQGIDILRARLAGKKISYPDGSDFDWR